MTAYLWVAIGSALGGMARYWCSGFVAERVGETFPWGTLAVNVIGSFAIGALASLTGPDSRFLFGSFTRQFAMIGLCGGYTTFSAFSLQTLTLLRDGEGLRAAANIGLSVTLCMAAVWLGYAVMESINQMKG